MLDVNTSWFLGAVLFTGLAGGAGVRLGRGTPGTLRASVGGAVAWMLGWAWLVHHPDVAVQFLPLEFLTRIEGFGGVPAFMLLLGVLWSRTGLNRQRAVVVWAAAFGGVYFVNGGMWLLQDTPTAVMGHAYADPNSGVVLQSQDYSCVAASCATALNVLGLPSTEAQLARLTDTRPGTGATLLRALRGLNARLAGRPLRARLVSLRAEVIPRLDLPALTTLQYERTRRHMVVILAAHNDGLWLMDPMTGLYQIDAEAFRSVFGGSVIVFDGPRPRAVDAGQNARARAVAVAAPR